MNVIFVIIKFEREMLEFITTIWMRDEKRNTAASCFWLLLTAGCEKKYCEFISSYFRFSVSMHAMIAFRQVASLPIVIALLPTLRCYLHKGEARHKSLFARILLFLSLNFSFQFKTMIWNRTINILLSASNFHSIELPWLHFSVSF